MPSLPAAVLRDPAALAEALDEHGACLLLGFPSPSGTAGLRVELRRLQSTDALRPAEVGHGRSHHLRIAIRGDDTRWMDADSGAAATAYISALRSLRVAMNRRLFLGLEEEEAHFACYPTGASYHRHRDQFQDSDARVLSIVSYLNEDWLPDARRRVAPAPAAGRCRRPAPCGNQRCFSERDRARSIARHTRAFEHGGLVARVLLLLQERL